MVGEGGGAIDVPHFRIFVVRLLEFYVPIPQIMWPPFSSLHFFCSEAQRAMHALCFTGRYRIYLYH